MGGPSFEINLPAAPEPGSVATQPAADGTVSFAGVRLGGPQFGALLLVKGGYSFAADPREALERETTAGGDAHLLAPVGPIRPTMVGNTPAYARDFVMVRSGRHIREFRFSRDGQGYGAGIVYYPRDRITLDTGLAALRTFRWLG